MIEFTINDIKNTVEVLCNSAGFRVIKFHVVKIEEKKPEIKFPCIMRGRSGLRVLMIRETTDNSEVRIGEGYVITPNHAHKYMTFGNEWLIESFKVEEEPPMLMPRVPQQQQ